MSSPAVRALRTAQAIASEAALPGSIQINEKLYFCGTDAVLNLIREQDQSLSAIMLVFHNPDITNLVNKLTEQAIVNLPTTAVVQIEFRLKSWAAIDYGLGKLIEFDYPKRRVDG